MSVSVCHIIGGIVGGGIEQVVVNYCSRIKDIEFDLLYQYEPNLGCLQKLERAGVKCFQIPDKKRYPIKHIFSIWSFLKKNKYDVVHVHLDWFLSWIICLVALFAGVKKRIIHHHQVYREKNIAIKICFSVMRRMNMFFSTHRVACSAAAAVNGFGWKAYENGRVVVLQNAVDVKQFEYDEKKRNEIRQKYRINDRLCVGCIGRICYQKNQMFLLSACKQILLLKKDVLLMLVGEGPDSGKIKKAIKNLGIEDNVLLLNTQSDVAPFYSAMDVFCLPSRWEGLGMVLVEAQINGLRCLASDKVPQTVKISNNLTFLPIEDSSVWADSVLNATTSRDKNVDVKDYDINERYKDLERIYLEE